MISSFTITSAGGAAGYHDKAFSQDGQSMRADNYYVSEQAQAMWQGEGAELLGAKDSPVEREDFIAYLEGRLTNPETGEIQDLSHNSKGDNRRLGFDFTVSPSKSVSIVALIGQDERVFEAHDKANAAAMSWLEEHAAIYRAKGEDGVNIYMQGGNLLYATVQHHTNRENEPQLHNHNVIVAAVYDKADQKWRSLTNDELLRLRSKADIIYKSELAAGLKRAGYELEHDANGVDFEIKGVSKEQVAAFSARSEQIEKALLARNIDPSEASYEARQAATLASRSAKRELPREDLQRTWSEAASGTGLDLGAVVGAARERAAQKGLSQDLEATADAKAKQAGLEAVSWAVKHLSEREQSFLKTDLETEAIKFSGAQATLKDVRWGIEQQLARGVLIERGKDDEGRAVYTTMSGVTYERSLLSMVEAGKEKGRPLLTNDTEFATAVIAFEARKSEELGKPFKLSDEQLVSAQNVLMHRDQWQGIQGDAGTGKTAALEFVRGAAEERGWNIMGIATSAKAARELEESSGVKSQTVASFMATRDQAIRLAELEVKELTSALQAKEAIGPAQDRTQTKTLQFEVDGKDYGHNTYVFDNARSEVYRKGDDLANRVGSFFAEFAENAREKAGAGGEQLSARFYAAAAGASEKLANSLNSYEKVGEVEAIGARNALYLEEDKATADLRTRLKTRQAALSNLQATGNEEGRKTLLIMDESSLTGVKDTEAVGRLVSSIDARVVLQGDIKQHGSVAAGRAFEQVQKAGINLSKLEETRRFTDASPQTKEGLAEMKLGKYGEGLAKLNTTIVKDEQMSQTVAARYLANLTDLQTADKDLRPEHAAIGVVALRNAERKDYNAAIHAALVQSGKISKEEFTKGHFDDPKLTYAQAVNVAQLRASDATHLVFRKSYREYGIKDGDVLEIKGYDTAKNRVLAQNAEGKDVNFNPKAADLFRVAVLENRVYSVGDKVEARQNIDIGNDRSNRITNGQAGFISGIDQDGAVITWTNGKITQLTNDQMRAVDLAYVHTTFKEQGATNLREIIAMDSAGAKVMNRQAAYVAATRAKQNTEIVTSDMAKVIKNADRDVEKTTAISDTKFADIRQGRIYNAQLAALDEKPRMPATSRDQGLGRAEATKSQEQGQQPNRQVDRAGKNQPRPQEQDHDLQR